MMAEAPILLTTVSQITQGSVGNGERRDWLGKTGIHT